MPAAAARLQRWVRTACAVLLLCGLPGAPAGAKSTNPARWEAADRAERAGLALDLRDPQAASAAFQDAGELFAEIADDRADPAGRAQALWRSARGFWRAADVLPRSAEDEQLAFYQRAADLASAGIEADPDCAECMLWRFSSIGRLATGRGVLAATRLPEMATLLDRAIALEPTYADDADYSTLGELHYSSAILYRAMPEWPVMSWLFGVRGDKQRSLDHIRTALSLHPNRLEYRVELGSQLVCLGTSEDDALRLEQGLATLRSAAGRAPRSLDDEREIAAARIMLGAPEKACAYSGDGWLEIERAPDPAVGSE